MSYVTRNFIKFLKEEVSTAVIAFLNMNRNMKDIDGPHLFKTNLKSRRENFSSTI